MPPYGIGSTAIGKVREIPFLEMYIFYAVGSYFEVRVIGYLISSIQIRVGIHRERVGYWKMPSNLTERNNKIRFKKIEGCESETACRGFCV